MAGKTSTIVSVASVCCAAAVTVAAISYVNNNTRTAEVAVTEQVGTSGIVIKDDGRNYQGEINDKVKKGNISVKMTANWVFENGGKSSNAYLANSERNEYDLRFEITLADTGEVIMVSPDVPVGSCIENFPLSVTLDKGIYDIIVAHQQVENGEVINTVRTTGVITVK